MRRIVARFSVLALVGLIPACGEGGSSPAAPVDRPDTPREFYVAVKENAEAWWRVVFSSIPGYFYKPITRFEGYGSFPPLTPCGELRQWNASYCPANAGIYYHTSLFETLWSDVGDAAPAYVIAHEMGHHGGWRLDWIPNLNISRKQGELQADCFAGAWIRSASDSGLLETGDLEEATATLILIGDPAQTWFDPSLHGTTEQRLFAFTSGFDSGVGKCTDTEWLELFPGSPAEAPEGGLGEGAAQISPLDPRDTR